MRLHVEERDDVGVRREFDDCVDSQGAVASVKQDDRNRRAICERLKVSEDLDRTISGLRTVDPEGRQDARFADEDGVVAVLGGEVGEFEGGGNAVAGDAGDEDLFGRGGFGGGAEDFAGFVVGEQRGLAGGAEDDEAGGGRFGVADDVGGEFARVEAAVRMERAW